MNTLTLIFKKKQEVDKDEFNNPVYELTPIVVEDCLIAPITEPTNAREKEAMTQSREQVRIHLPKTFDGDVSGSFVDYDGKCFRVDADSVVFMKDNCPTKWNRYFRAEVYDE